MKTTLASLLLLLSLAAAARADCIYEGVSYPEGTVIGPYVCRDGKWVLQQSQRGATGGARSALADSRVSVATATRSPRTRPAPAPG